MGENKSSREKACFDRTPSVSFHFRMFANVHWYTNHANDQITNRTLLASGAHLSNELSNGYRKKCTYITVCKNGVPIMRVELLVAYFSFGFRMV
jgi:hypothetical protein